MLLRDIRKVLRVGERSYAISIPKDWARKLGIKPGDPLELTLYSNTGIIEVRLPPHSKEHGFSAIKIPVNGCNSNYRISDLIEAAYSIGINKLFLDSKCVDKHSLVKLASSYPGLILHHHNGLVKVNIALSEELLSFNEVLDNIIVNLREIYDEFEAYMEKPSSRKNYIDGLIDEFYRNTRLLLRIISREQNGSFKKWFDVYLLHSSIRLLRILVKTLNHIINTVNGPVSGECINWFKRVDKVLFDSISIYKEPDLEKIVKVLEEAKALDNIPKECGIEGYMVSMKSVLDEIIQVTIEKCMFNEVLRK